MIDIHTIGAGGGSIARVDAAGLLLVGPESAGACPGPACYGAGGTSATVTDANVVLGRLPTAAAMAGSLPLNQQAAVQVIAALAKQLQLGTAETALGIIRLANDHMSQALRVISTQRGIDVRDYTLMCFGGAGGLHVCALAELMGMRKAIVPLRSGVLSALGMLLAPKQRVATRTIDQPLDQLDADTVNDLLTTLEQPLRTALLAEGITANAINVSYSVDVRYQGQSYCLELPWHNCQQAITDFHNLHQQRYGHKMDLPVTLFNVRVTLQGPPAAVQLPAFQAQTKATDMTVKVHGYREPVPCLQRDTLPAGQTITGPAVILEAVATTFIEQNWQAKVDSYGNLLLELLPSD